MKTKSTKSTESTTPATTTPTTPTATRRGILASLLAGLAGLLGRAAVKSAGLPAVRKIALVKVYRVDTLRELNCFTDVIEFVDDYSLLQWMDRRGLSDGKHGVDATILNAASLSYVTAYEIYPTVGNCAACNSGNVMCKRHEYDLYQQACKDAIATYGGTSKETVECRYFAKT